MWRWKNRHESRLSFWRWEKSAMNEQNYFGGEGASELVKTWDTKNVSDKGDLYVPNRTVIWPGKVVHAVRPTKSPVVKNNFQANFLNPFVSPLLLEPLSKMTERGPAVLEILGPRQDANGQNGRPSEPWSRQTSENHLKGCRNRK